MGLFSSLRNLKKWFTDKTGITESKEFKKRKHNECEQINNKRMRMDDSLVEVVEISDESLSEAEEVEITEPGPSTIPLRASPPIMLIDGRHHQRRTISSVKKANVIENNGHEKNFKILHSFSLAPRSAISNRTIGLVRSASSRSSHENNLTSINKGSKQTSLSMESGFSTLQINNNSINNSKDQTIAMILKHYVVPKSETTLSASSSKSPQSTCKEHVLNQSNISQKSDKENIDILPELSLHKNRIIKHEMFYERILRKFRENQATAALSSITVKQKTPEDIFKEKLDFMKKQLEKVELPKKKDVFPGYSQEVVNFIKNEMSDPINLHIVPGKNIKKNDLRTVYQPTCWLNDEVINHYLSLIISRDPTSLHTFDTFFYTKLSSHGYEAVRRWSRKKDIFACKKMFTPIHMGNHWCLICVNFVEKTIKYYDSLGGSNNKCLNTIFQYLIEEYKNKKNADFDCSGWRLLCAIDCPQQSNSYDCGMFACVIAEYLARDANLDFSQEDMPKLRHRLCYEILNNRLCYK